jgi:Dolichyl-phosphate-mannose-protein mannosyltransferase
MPSLVATIRRDPLLWTITAIVLAIHLAVAGRYDFFRDELYFIICGRHPAFGYVDQPALVPLLAAATQAFGHSLWLLRLPAALAATAVVPLTAALTRLLGGERGAGEIAGAAAGIAPVLLGLSATLFTSSFDALAWTAVAYFVARAALRDDGRALIWAGLVAGVDLEAKYGIVLWLVGLAIGLALTPERRLFARRKLWYGIAVALLIAAPSLVWQAVNGWPFLDVTAHHRTGNLTGAPLAFLGHQLFIVGPMLAPLWIAGLAAPFARRELRPARFLALAYVGAAVLTWAAHGKDYYIAGAYPTLFALGGILAMRTWRWLRIALIALAVAGSAVALPVALPVLPPALLLRYFELTHLRPKPDQKASEGAALTQLFSDQFGWRELERKVAAVYRALPPAERAKAAILADNYGEAAAIDFYGTADGLPPAISGHNQYYLWGPRGHDGSVIIRVNGNPGRWRRLCASLDVAATFGAPYVMPYENDRPIMVCRGFYADLRQVWPRFKFYF